jgi:hypothetical protein
MNPRLVATGVGGGLLGTAALFFPLYLVLPQTYSRSWSDVDPVFGYLGLAGAALALLGTGFIAARSSHSHSNRRRIQTGAMAGLLAAMIAFCLIGAAAAGVAGNGSVYQHGLRAVGSPENLKHIVAETVVQIT